MLEILNFIVGSTSTLLSALAIYLYIVLWKKDTTDGAYNAFDTMYKELLAVGLEYPELRNDKKTASFTSTFLDDDRIRYETYAFMCLNFCETLYDKGNKELMETWGVVLQIEYQLHKAWLSEGTNKSKFKQEFVSFLEQQSHSS